MTVRELRQLLFELEDQEAVIAVVTKTEHGVVRATRPIQCVDEADPDGKVPEGFVQISLGL